MDPQILLRTPNFRNWLEADASANAEFRAQKKGIDQLGQLIESARNRIGAHAEESVGDDFFAFVRENRSLIVPGAPSEDALADALAAAVMAAGLTAAWKEVTGTAASTMEALGNYLSATRDATLTLGRALFCITGLYAEKRPNARDALAAALAGTATQSNGTTGS